MQLITYLSTAAAMVASVSAHKSAVELNKEYTPSAPGARIINRCNYPVHVWSVLKGIGCPESGMVTLKKGEIYNENYQEDSSVGVSIKVSKTTQCGGSDIVQLEYFLQKDGMWSNNYLDVSYVDCLGGDCPTKNEGYYLTAGNATAKAAKAATDGSWCPTQFCHDAASCAKISYILPNDVQTKTCDCESSMDFYMCGSEGPGDEEEQPAYSAPAPASSSPQVESPAPEPSTTAQPATTPAAEGYNVKAAAVTSAPAVEEPKEPKVKTKVVYVTAYEYVNAKRHEHAHAHARRHQPFHA